MTDKRLYPNTVIFQTTDGKGVTYYNARVLEQIRAEIEKLEPFDSLDDYSEAIEDVLDIIYKYIKEQAE